MKKSTIARIVEGIISAVITTFIVYYSLTNKDIYNFIRIIHEGKTNAFEVSLCLLPVFIIIFCSVNLIGTAIDNKNLK